jgi:hypothetical protein
MGDEKAHKMDEQTNEFEEVVSLVNEAQKQNVFNLADAIKGRSAPEKAVTVYTDVQTALELQDINAKMNDFTNIMDEAKYSVLEKQAKELSEKISSSRLIFHMRGIDQERVEKVTSAIGGDRAKDSTLEFARDYTCALVADNIVKVENANGEIDERKFDLEDGRQLYKSLPSEAWMALVNTMEQLTLATGIFKGITDAGFLPKS